jgi:hypothetical protein
MTSLIAYSDDASYCALYIRVDESDYVFQASLKASLMASLMTSLIASLMTSLMTSVMTSLIR